MGLAGDASDAKGPAGDASDAKGPAGAAPPTSEASESGQRGAWSFFDTLLVVLSAIVVISHLLGAGPLTGVLWGSHAFAFFPPGVLASSLAALAALTLGATFALRRAPAPRSLSRPALVSIVLAAGSLALFWLLRIRHTFLGDGSVLTKDLPLGLSAHPHQPLTVYLHQKVFGALGGFFEAAGKPAADVARDTVALSSVIAGAVFVVVVYALARAIARRATDGGNSSVTLLLTGVLLAQGYMQLFFGYVENYTFFTLGLGLYLLASIAYLEKRVPLFVPGAALVLALGFHLSAVIMLPSFVVLVIAGLRRARNATLRDVAVTALLVAGLQLALSAIQPGYSLAAKLSEIFGLAARGHGEAGRLAYLLSAEHWRDFFNEQFLIGPLSAFLFVPAAAYGLARGSARNAAGLFFIVAGLTALASAWLTTELNLGYARDWDLFAPYAIVYVAGATVCMVPHFATAARARMFLAAALLVSVFHTAPWIALNASFERSFERFKTLPLGRGRTEATVGYWYLTHDLPDSAKTWFEKSVAAHPGNNLAHYSLGVIALDEGRHGDAIRRLATATRLRPDKNEYRVRLADALVMAGRPEDALPHLQELTRREPGRASYWACLGVVLLGLDRADDAGTALDRAIELAPGDELYRELRDNLSEPGLYDAVIDSTWIEIVTR